MDASALSVVSQTVKMSVALSGGMLNPQLTREERENLGCIGGRGIQTQSLMHVSSEQKQNRGARKILLSERFVQPRRQRNEQLYLSRDRVKLLRPEEDRTTVYEFR